MNGVGEYVVFYAPEAVQAKVKRWRSMLIQRLISTAISVAIGAAVWYFFADQVGSWGPWLVGSALVVGLIWVIVSVTGLVIARTFITLIAGIGRMDFRRFITWSGVGAVIWAAGLTVLGYFLGTIPFINTNLELVLVIIVLISVVPMVVEYLRERRKLKANAAVE